MVHKRTGRYSLVLLAAGHEYESFLGRIGETKIWEFGKQNLLGVQIDKYLSFNEHVSDLCKKARRKLSVLANMSLKRRRVLMRVFIEAQFGKCPLVWMFYGRMLHIKFNHLHEHSPRYLYRDSASSFRELLQKDLLLSLFIIEMSKVWLWNYTK